MIIFEDTRRIMLYPGSIKSSVSVSVSVFRHRHRHSAASHIIFIHFTHFTLHTQRASTETRTVTMAMIASAAPDSRSAAAGEHPSDSAKLHPRPCDRPSS